MNSEPRLVAEHEKDLQTAFFFRPRRWALSYQPSALLRIVVVSANISPNFIAAGMTSFSVSL